MKISTKMPPGFTVFTSVAVFNFLLFIGILILLGGESIPIKSETGKYLLWGTGGSAPHTDHKHYFEITKGLYFYIMVHGVSAAALLLVALFKDILSPMIRRRSA